MQLKHNFIMLYTRLQTMLRDRIRKPRRHVEIVSHDAVSRSIWTRWNSDHGTLQSAPYDVKHKPVNLPGVSQEE
ncbi:hypothetical protein UVI_02055950 [Ustilaginoidea virens]|uniref:Uncharacterized protein n=1 Tax=Ustilaginoidea virens TaxID=1159556 RepID=A0A1B5KY70_USTVR|nr:hypothetical protein UVI_02055950 [Ustilaginoidea virens]